MLHRCQFLTEPPPPWKHSVSSPILNCCSVFGIRVPGDDPEISLTANSPIVSSKTVTTLFRDGNSVTLYIATGLCPLHPWPLPQSDWKPSVVYPRLLCSMYPMPCTGYPLHPCQRYALGPHLDPTTRGFTQNVPVHDNFSATPEVRGISSQVWITILF